MPAELPISCDLRRFVQSENCRYYCAFWRRKPIIESIGNHSFRATGITAYLANGGALEHAQAMAAHESPRTTKLYDRAKERLTQHEIKRIVM
jgi:integrase